MDDPQVHLARFADLDAVTGYRLWQLREAVFVVEQQCPYPELDGRDLEPETRHLWLEQEDRPVAYLRLLEDPGSGADGTVRIGRVLVAPEHRGRGLARRLVQAALDLVAGRPCRLDAQSHLAGWYARMGFEACGSEFVEDGIPHVPMRRTATAGPQS